MQYASIFLFSNLKLWVGGIGHTSVLRSVKHALVLVGWEVINSKTWFHHEKNYWEKPLGVILGSSAVNIFTTFNL